VRNKNKDAVGLQRRGYIGIDPSIYPPKIRPGKFLWSKMTS